MNTASSEVISCFYDSQEFLTTPQSSTSINKTKKTRQALKTQYLILLKKKIIWQRRCCFQVKLYSATYVPLSPFLLNLLIQYEFSCGVVN